jgi:hypothetical protein
VGRWRTLRCAHGRSLQPHPRCIECAYNPNLVNARRVPVLLLALAVITVVTWWLQGTPDDDALPDLETTTSDDSRDAPGLRTFGTTPQPKGVSTPESPDTPVVPRRAAVHGKNLLRGSVRYEDGTVPEHCELTFWRMRPDGSGSGWSAKAVKGVLTGPSLAPGRHQVRDARTEDGQPTVVSGPVTIGLGTPIEIVLRRGTRRGLTLVDAETGAPLSQGVVLTVDSGFEVGPFGEKPKIILPSLHAARRKPVHVDASGSVELPENNTVRRLVVGAPGHAWKRITLDPTTEQHTTIELDRAGSIEVLVPFWGELESATFVVTRAASLDKGQVAFGARALAGEGGLFKIDGLPPGDYTFGVVARAMVSVSRVYARGQAHVELGTTQRIELRREAEEKPTLATLKGTFRVPETWDEAGWRVLAYGAAGDTIGERETAHVGDEATARTVPFSFPAMTPGRYVLMLRPIGWRTEVTLTEAMEPVVLEVPAPTEAAVRIVDADDGADLPEAELRWTAVMPADVSSRLRPAARPNGEAAHALRCAPGRFLLRASAPGYVTTTAHVLWDRSGRVHHLIKLQRGGMLRIRLLHEDTVVHAKGAKFLVRMGAIKSRSFVAKDGSAEADGLEPGTWTVHLYRDLAGYFPPEPVRVVLKAGDEQTVDLILKSTQR